MSKIKILVIPSDRYGIGSFRFIEPHIEIQKQFPDEFEVTINMQVDFTDLNYLNEFNIIFGHKEMCTVEQAKVLFPQLKKDGIKVIIDIDDYWELGKNHPHYQYAQDIKLADRITSMLFYSDYVTTSTEQFASEIKKFNNKVLVFPNAIDPTSKKFQINNIESEKVRIGWLGGSCYDDQTEILTENGYKLFKDLEEGEKVATLNPNNNELNFVEPTNYIKNKYDGEIYVVNSKNINFAVTPNHNMYASVVKNLGHKKLNYNLIPMDELENKNLHFKKDCNWNGFNQEYFVIPGIYNVYKEDHKLSSDIKILMSDWIKFFGFWVAEGWTSTTQGLYQVGIAQKKDNGVLTEMFELLKRIGFNPTYTKDKFQVRVFDKRLWKYLSRFGKAENKYVPQEILDLPSNLLENFLKYYIIGDGNRCLKTGKVVCYTSSKLLADNICEIALKTNTSAYLKNRGIRNSIMNDGREVNGKHDSLEICIQKKEGKHNHLNPLVRKEQIKKEYYDGYVYCVSVPSHIIYVRRNGKSFWCGNSHLHDLKLLKPMFDSVNEKFKGKIQTVLCGFDTRGKVKEQDENGQRRERDITPMETCWYLYEKIFTSDYKYLSPEYKKFLMKFKNEIYPLVEKEQYRRVDTKPMSTYSLNYNLMDISLAPLEVNKFNIFKSQLKIIESGFFKKPVIASEISPYMIDIKHGENGFLVKNNSSTKNFTYYVNKLINDPDLRKQMGESLYETVKDKYDIRNVSKDRADFYKSILK